MKPQYICKKIEDAYKQGYYAADTGAHNPYTVGAQTAYWHAFNAGKHDRRRGFTYEPLKVPVSTAVRTGRAGQVIK